MLAAALADDDALHWEMDATKPPSPKWKQPQAKEECLHDLVSTVKMAMSAKKAQVGTQRLPNGSKSIEKSDLIH